MKNLPKLFAVCFAVLLTFGMAACGNDSKITKAELENQNGDNVTVFPSEKPSLIFLFTTAG